MKHVLITVSGEIPASLASDIDAGRRPEADYRAMAKRFDADLLDYREARKVTGRVGAALEASAGPSAMLAWACFKLRRRYRVIFTDGEQIGLPLALLLKLRGGRGPRPAHMMIVHVLSPWKKAALIDRFALHTHIDQFLVYSSYQQTFIRERWQLPEARVVFTPFMVDSNFFAPGKVQPSEYPAWLRELDKPIICAVGLERRDYPTLLEAVRGLGGSVIIAAASPWSKQSDTTSGHQVPDNVLVRKFSQFELRYVYDASSMLVMPLFDVEFQAGVTAILEAFSMAKPVVCTRTKGQTDVIEEGHNGLYVPPGDATALRDAVRTLLDDPARAAEMGRRGRTLIDEEMSLDHYVERLGAWVQQHQHQHVG